MGQLQAAYTHVTGVPGKEEREAVLEKTGEGRLSI